MTDRIYTRFIWKESVPLVKLSLTWIRYFYCEDEFCRIGQGAFLGSLTPRQRGVFSTAAYHEPEQSRHQIGQVDIRQFPIRSFGDRVEISDQREQHSESRQPRNNLRAGTKE
jgi:hypothetical protein